MVKSELIHKTWHVIDKAIEKKKIESIVNTFIAVIQEELKQNGSVKIEGLGSFSMRVRNSYTIKDANTGKVKEMPKSVYIDFRPSKKIKRD